MEISFVSQRKESSIIFLIAGFLEIFSGTKYFKKSFCEKWVHELIGLTESLRNLWPGEGKKIKNSFSVTVRYECIILNRIFLA